MKLDVRQRGAMAPYGPNVAPPVISILSTNTGLKDPIHDLQYLYYIILSNK
jgi:hypothetical protein